MPVQKQMLFCCWIHINNIRIFISIFYIIIITAAIENVRSHAYDSYGHPGSPWTPSAVLLPAVETSDLVGDHKSERDLDRQTEKVLYNFCIEEDTPAGAVSGTGLINW